MAVREVPLTRGRHNWPGKAETLRCGLKRMPFAFPLVKQGMRDCQVEAITGLETSLGRGDPMMLIRMATVADDLGSETFGEGMTYASI